MLAQINDIRLNFQDTGELNSTNTIVFVHGFPFSLEMWSGQIKVLSEIKDLRVITYDIRGHGKSEIGDGQYSIELFVDDLVALLDHLNVTKTILCGFSMGGYIALRAIERNPDRFNALVLCDTQSAADSNEGKIRRANSVKLVKREGVAKFSEGFLKAVFIPETFSARHEIIEDARKIVLATSPIGICGALLAMAARTDTTDVLSKISVPTLILVGEHDNVTPPSAAKIMQDKIANSKLHVISHAAHMSNLENPAEFNEYLAQFVMTI
jgi:3-oxoadipate enol-lactonase